MLVGGSLIMQIVIEVKDKELGRKILSILSLLQDDRIIVKEVTPATRGDVEISGEISDEYIDKHWMQLAMTDVDLQADDDDILEEAYIEYLEETKDANLG
jgi:hypothetical protein